MAYYDRESNSFILEESDRQSFTMPEDAGDASVQGTSNNDVIFGNSAGNIIDGREGNDVMFGGGGDDTYYVDHARDEAIEERGSFDHDAVVTSVSYALGSFVEDLTATGAASINLTGNDLRNKLIGNDGDNVLDGGGGGDLMAGGSGNDTYYVDDPNELIMEWDNGGLDHVITTISQTLGDSLENLTAIGSLDVALTGNGLDNVITGNAAANRLDGDAGNDTLDGGVGGDVMSGGVGDDVYYVESQEDKVLETATGGANDRVYARVSHTLASYVENLTAAGTGAINLTGNASANTLVGNVGRNTIKAGNGNDRLDGGYGSDALTGGSGKDVFVFKDKLSKSANLDRILDYKVADDTIHLENAIFRKLTKTGALSKSFFASGPKAKDKNDYIVYDKGTGTLYYDADGSGKGKAVAFAKLAAGLKMASSEFKVI